MKIIGSTFQPNVNRLILQIKHFFYFLPQGTSRKLGPFEPHRRTSASRCSPARTALNFDPKIRKVNYLDKFDSSVEQSPRGSFPYGKTTSFSPKFRLVPYGNMSP